MKKILLICALMCSSLVHSAEINITNPKYISHEKIAHSDGYDEKGRFTGTNLYRALFDVSLSEKKYTVPVVFSQTEITGKLDFFSSENMQLIAPHDSMNQLKKDNIDLQELDKKMPEIAQKLLPKKL